MERPEFSRNKIIFAILYRRMRVCVYVSVYMYFLKNNYFFVNFSRLRLRRCVCLYTVCVCLNARVYAYVCMYSRGKKEESSKFSQSVKVLSRLWIETRRSLLW